MLKKLKRKFVIINMCLVGIVLLTVFTVVCVNAYNQALSEVDGALMMALEKTEKDKFEPFEIGKQPKGRQQSMQPIRGTQPMEGKPFNYAAVVVLVEEEEGERNITTLGMENAFMDEAVLSTAVEAAISSGEPEGRLDDMELFYMKSEGIYGTKIAFADSKYFKASVKKTFLTSLILFVLGMAALLLISLLLARIAVAPVKKAWEQQRRFVADASHELKTPLTVILANSEIMMSRLENEDKDEAEVCGTEEKAYMKKWLESSQEEANHMKSLVDDLLFLAKADEADTIKTVFSEKTDVDISDVVTGVALQMEPVVYENGAVMGISIEEGLHMRCNLTQMKQLVHILLDNAVKYCGKAGRVELDLFKRDGMINLIVANTGEIIDPKDLEHIFDRFYRSDKARTGEGHGLGLSIAKTIVDNNGGTITAASGSLRQQAGIPDVITEGTVITVVFPI